MRKYLLILIFGIAPLLFIAWAANAQSSNGGTAGLSLVPAINEKVVGAGQLSIMPVRITNITDSPQAVKVGFQPIAPIDPLINDEYKDRYDASSWLSVDIPEFILEANESKAVEVRVLPPGNAGPGGHYANVVFRLIPTQGGQTDGSSTAVRPEIVSLFMMTVPGNIDELATAEFRSPGLLKQSKHRYLEAEITNLGNIHLLPNSNVVIRDLSGQEVTRLPMSSKLLIPGTSTMLSAAWQNADPGLYRAHYDIAYGSPSKHLNHTSEIIVVLPALWIQIVVVIFLSLIARTALPPLFRRLKRRRLKLNMDLTGEPNINIPREKVENAAMQSRLKDVSKKK